MPVAWAKELGKPAAAVHGGAAARVVAAVASPAMALWMEALGSLSDTVWCSCVRKESKKEDGGVRSMKWSTPASDSWPVKAYQGELT